jgi:hypothetical protein
MGIERRKREEAPLPARTFDMAAAAASPWLRAATTATFAVAWICALVAVLFQVLWGPWQANVPGGPDQR